MYTQISAQMAGKIRRSVKCFQYQLSYAVLQHANYQQTSEAGRRAVEPD